MCVCVCVCVYMCICFCIWRYLERGTVQEIQMEQVILVNNVEGSSEISESRERLLLPMSSFRKALLLH